MILSNRNFVVIQTFLGADDSYFDCTDLTESLFSSHKDEYPEHERASLKQLYQAKV